MLGLSIDLPELILHQLYFDFVLTDIIEEVIADLHPNDKPYKSQSIGSSHCRFIELR